MRYVCIAASHSLAYIVKVDAFQLQGTGLSKGPLGFRID